MRICLYTATAHPKLGGQEAVVDALARHFTAMGHHPVVLAPRPRLPMRPKDDQLPYPVARHPRFYSTRRLISFYRRYLVKLHAREQFDLIHCHDVYPTGYLAVLSKQRLNVPIVITSHGGDVKEGNIRISKPGMRARYVRAVEQADALISIGKFTEEGFHKLSPNLPRIVAIPNGIDLEPFSAPAPRPASLDPQIVPGKYFLFLGRLKVRKGVDVLIDAVARLADTGIVQCVIAGSGEDEGVLKERVRSSGLEERIRFVGRVEGSAKLYLLQNTLCIVMPSRVWEAFPLVLIEAYAAGKAVIGSDVPGIADLVREGHTGMLAPQESPEALAAAMSRMLAEPEVARRLGENARAVAQDYSWDAVARAHVELYEQARAGYIPAAR